LRGGARLAEDGRAGLLVEDALHAVAEHFMIINDEDSAHCYCLTARAPPAGRLRLTHLAGDRDAHGNHSTLARSPYDVKRAADELGALSHPQQAECALARLLIFCDAPSVVADR